MGEKREQKEGRKNMKQKRRDERRTGGKMERVGGGEKMERVIVEMEKVAK